MAHKYAMAFKGLRPEGCSSTQASGYEPCTLLANYSVLSLESTEVNIGSAHLANSLPPSSLATGLREGEGAGQGLRRQGQGVSLHLGGTHKGSQTRPFRCGGGVVGG